MLALAVRADFGLFTQDVPAHLRSAEVIAEAAAVAEANKLFGEFASGLTALRIVPPMSVMSALANYRAFARRKARQAFLSLVRVDKAMSAARIPWVAYKGQTLQIQLGLDPAHRPANDVDILVHKADFDRAVEALKQSGCMVPPAFATPWWRDWLGEMPLIPTPGSGPPIDVHHKVQQPGCPRPRDTGRMLSEANLVVYDSLTIPTLSPLNATLLGAICVVKAFARHEVGGSHVMDLARMLMRADDAFSAALADEAKHQGLSKSLGLAKQSVDAFLRAPLELNEHAPTDGPDWLGMILTPDCVGHARLRGRTLLWKLSDGNTLTRIGRFVRDSLIVIGAERSRRRYDHEHLSTEGFTIGTG